MGTLDCQLGTDISDKSIGAHSNGVLCAVLELTILKESEGPLVCPEVVNKVGERAGRHVL